MELVKLLVLIEDFACRCTTAIFRTPPKGLALR